MNHDVMTLTGGQCVTVQRALKDMRKKFPGTDETDPESVTKALQNTYDLSDDDADQLGMIIWDEGISAGL